MVTIADLRAARHNSNFNDVLLDYLEENDPGSEQVVITRLDPPKSPTAADASSVATFTPVHSE